MADSAPRADSRPSMAYPREGGGGFDRAVFFSDAVFAIALTLVAVEIGIPEIDAGSSPSALVAALVELAPKVGAYIVAFLWVAFYWRANHRFTTTLRGMSSRYVLALLLYLGFVALLPFPAATLGEYWSNPVAIAFFALFAAAVSSLEVLLLVVAHRDGLFLTPLSTGEYRGAVLGGLTPVPAFLLSVPVAFVSPVAAVLCWLVIAVGLGALLTRFGPGPVGGARPRSQGPREQWENGRRSTPGES